MPRLIDLCRHDAEPHQVLVDGLYVSPLQPPPRYFFDALGSTLFSAITQLPDYYPARLERDTLSRHAPKMADLLPRKATLIDLGAGDGSKAQYLLRHLQPARYVDVDVAAESIWQALRRIAPEHSDIEMSIVA